MRVILGVVDAHGAASEWSHGPGARCKQPKAIVRNSPFNLHISKAGAACVLSGTYVDPLPFTAHSSPGLSLCQSPSIQAL